MTDKKKHPLDETFDMESDLVESPVIVELPENPTLDDIVRLSLEAYKLQVEGCELLEPKFRARSLEVAEKFLSTAKDALTKKTELSQKQEKLDSELNKKKDGEQEEEEKKGGVSRQALLYEINQVKKNEAV